MEAKFVGNFGSVHSILRFGEQSIIKSELIQQAYRQILFVGKDQEQCIPQFVLIQHTLQFLTGLYHAIAVIAINNKDDTLSVLEIMPPQRSDLVLSTNIPYGKLNVFVLDGFNIESCSDVISAKLPRKFTSISYESGRTNSGDGRNDFAELELI